MNVKSRLVIAFDLVGTLLDLSALDTIFQSEFGDVHIRKEWFVELLKIAFAITASGRYEGFSDIAQAALKIVEERHRKHLRSAQRRTIVRSLPQLPPVADVKPGLEALRSEGRRLAVLTNSALKAAKQAVESAGLTQFFDGIYSAESVKRLKPAPEPYLMLAKEFAVKTRDIFLVAAHSWDITGAANAGCRTCFLRRPEQVLDELTPKPDLVVSDLREIAQHLTKKRKAA